MTFWNKVQQGVGRAAAEAEKQARIARLGMQIGEVEGTIRQKTTELGDSALKLIRAGELKEPTFDAIVEEIGKQEARLSELRRELSAIQSAVQ